MSLERPSQPRESVFYDGVHWRVTLDGTHSVPVHRKLGAIIRMGLYASKKLPEITQRLPRHELHMDAIYRNHHAYNCHRTALEIQGEALDLYDAAYSYKPKILEKFSDPRNAVTHIEGVRDIVREGTFPRWVHFMSEREESPLHSTCILGVDERGTYICFEKQSYYDAPFHLIKLDDVLRQFSSIVHTACVEPAMEQYRVSK
jgi:hypothetical protein